jgi:hypothetical protein
MSTKITPTKAIKLFCMECTCEQRDEIKNCSAPKCPLYSFRPYKGTTEKASTKNDVKAERGKKTMSPEHKEKMKKARETKRADRVAAGLPASTRVAKVKPAKVVKNTSKAIAAKARMTPEHKLRMAEGRARKKAALVAGYAEVSEKVAMKTVAGKSNKKTNPIAAASEGQVISLKDLRKFKRTERGH